MLITLIHQLLQIISTKKFQCETKLFTVSPEPYYQNKKQMQISIRYLIMYKN